jgi:protein CWC15
MTTAHRPTWKPAVGQSNAGGWTAGGTASGRTATLDLAAHTKLKLRKGPQIVDKKAALRESLFKLEEAEAKAPKIGRRQINPAIEEEGRRKLLKQTAEVDENR